MDPITLALLGSTAISGIGSLLGASNASDAAKANTAASMAESQRREREFQQSMDLARQQYQDAMLGVTTGTGSSLKFVPGQGWVTTLGATDQALQNRNIRAGSAADALMNEFLRYQPITGERMSGLLYDKAIRGLNDRFSGQMAEGMRTATRQGNPQLAAAISAAIGKQQGEEYRNAAIDSEIAGREYADKANINNRNAFANLYGAFAGQSKGDVGPTGYLPQLTTGASNAGKNLLTASFSDTAKAPVTQPDTAFGSALASIGQLGYGALKDYTSTQRQNDFLDVLRQKYGVGGGNRGLY